ncbi:MAG: phosphotransferase [Planctomycetaceae bacterium]
MSPGIAEAARIPDSVGRAFGFTIHNATVATGGFSGVRVFRATTNDGRELAVRGTPAAQVLPSGRIVGLYRLLRWISQAGDCPVPVPLVPAVGVFPASPQRRKHQAEPWLRQHEIIWQVEPWLPGHPLHGNELSADHVNAALSSLNRFHQLAAEAVRILGADEWFMNTTKPSPAVTRRLKIVQELRDGKLEMLHRHLAVDTDERFRGLAIRVCQALRTRLPGLHHALSALVDTRFRIQPVLRDVWRAHVLFTGTQVSGLIDLSAAASDHVTVDVARLIRSWFGSNSALVRNAQSHYQSLQVLNGSEQRLLQALDASSVLLSPVTWLQRRMESGSRGRWAEEVHLRLAELTEVAENL